MSQETYSGHTVSVKSQNNYEIEFAGSERKIAIGSVTSTFNPNGHLLWRPTLIE